MPTDHTCPHWPAAGDVCDLSPCGCGGGTLRTGAVILHLGRPQLAALLQLAGGASALAEPSAQSPVAGEAPATPPPPRRRRRPARVLH